MKPKKYIYILLTGMFMLSSCVREENLGGDDFYEEGIETTISFKVGVPEMSIATRADMETGSDSELNSLWVGIFSATTGKCTYANMHDEIPTLHGNGSGYITLNGIKTQSGPSYIVAVGNPKNNYGYLHEAGKRLSRVDLTTLLPATTDKATNFTWETYQNLAIRQLDVNDVATPTGNLVMSGVYYDSRSGHGNQNNENPTPGDWEKANYTPVVIPVPASQNETVTLSGAIHLRRLISQVKFHIQAVDYDGFDANKREAKRIVEVIPQSYKVVNVPYTSWLHERQSLDGNKKPIGSANSGDVIQLNSSIFDYGSGPTALKPNYRTSASFNGNQYITEYKKTENGQQVTDYYEFDFWMLENKRWALSDLGTGQEAYDKREEEYKDDGEKNGKSLKLNSGLYKALCSSREEETMNNCASFVEIKCRIIYTEDGLSAINPGVTDPEDREIKYRTADAVYTVHLGGIGHNWNDFTHRRNHIYTYNVTVVDVDRIIVEATEEEESRPGIEGVVTDVTNAPFDLDAHYGVFNILLTNLQRTGGTQPDGTIRNRFPFRIKVYDGKDEAFYIDQDNYEDYDELYWTWVEFRPTSGPDVLAAYKPYYLKNSDGTDRNERYRDENGNLTTFRLNEIADINTYPGWQGSKNPNDKTEQWYTVFVNEYVYEKFFNEEQNNWVNYVNKSPRMCWLNTDGISSKDEESTYIKSQYVIRQTSIQTFYDIPEGHDIASEPLDAIGIEHVNEVFGFNLRWNNASLDYSGHKLRNNNGRHNEWLYITNGNNTIKRWDNYYDMTRNQMIEGIQNGKNGKLKSYQSDLYIDLSEGPYYVPSINTYTQNNFVDEIYKKHDINETYTVQILNACMNRNRDNNGNGQIDLEELRWYVPASSEILDIVLGRNSMDDPLMDYSKNYALDSPNTNLSQKHHANTRFHYATSNNRVLWAEEGVTINPESDNINDGWNLPPQQIRCARALGTNLSTDNTNDLSPAFTTNAEYADEAKTIITKYPTEIYPTYYNAKNMRSYISGSIAPHQETSQLNRLCSDGFEFQKEVIPFGRNGWHTPGARNNWTWMNLYILPSTDSNTGVFDQNEFVRDHDAVLNEANQRCREYYGSEWRIPNMKEAALIKLALDNVKIYKPSPNYQSNVVSGYGIGSFLTGTYREYGIDGQESRGDKTGYYTAIYYPEEPGSDDYDAEGHLLGRIHCVTSSWSQHYYIRCVRDIKSSGD